MVKITSFTKQKEQNFVDLLIRNEIYHLNFVKVDQLQEIFDIQLRKIGQQDYAGLGICLKSKLQDQTKCVVVGTKLLIVSSLSITNLCIQSSWCSSESELFVYRVVKA